MIHTHERKQLDSKLNISKQKNPVFRTGIVFFQERTVLCEELLKWGRVQLKECPNQKCTEMSTHLVDIDGPLLIAVITLGTQ